ncbi:hypothetical protein DFJ58DRAFT_846412 [Suillus subalutaceus]|uniref:uncharacterized protein n=1 Tax=Suillus subalutaceus TaxID=48586 RepID=UPI001B867A87|nr:uncharacterized protein DFJ58DRAFT_846412 [Suillus subalutaceus]KAG1837571.1 hypothetical protein DFJ58DRAFT_846412 [Suillus subalutaceus]
MSISNTDFSSGSTRYSHDFLTPLLHAVEMAQSSTSKTHTPLSATIPQASPDLFNDTHSFAGTPSASGFSHGAYMHSVTPNFQQMHVLQEQLSLYQAKLSETQLELCKTMTEHDTIKASFRELIAVLRLPESTDPLNFSLTSSTLTVHDKVLHPSRESHPKVHFWTRTDYNKYIENAESGSGTRGKVPWLALEDGGPVTVEQLRAIRKAIHAAWAELVVQKMAPPTWLRICATSKKLVFNIVDAPGKILTKEELVEDDSDLVISESKRTVHNKNGKRGISTAFDGYKRSPACWTKFSPTHHSQTSLSAQGANKENKFVLQNPLPIKKTDDGPAASNRPLDNKASKKKMRPGVAKNARNLCALRWLKQVKMNGTTDESCDEYKADVERLQSADFILFFSSIVPSNKSVLVIAQDDEGMRDPTDPLPDMADLADFREFRGGGYNTRSEDPLQRNGFKS